MDKSLIVEKDNEEFHQHREQQKKRNKSDGAYNTQSKKRSISTRSQNKGKVVPNSYVSCLTCGKKHRSRAML